VLYVLLFYPFGSLYGFVEPKRSFLFAQRKTSSRLNIYINQRRPQTDRRIVNCTRLIFCVPRSIIQIYIHIYTRSGNASARAPFKLINCVLDSNELPFSDGGEGDTGGGHLSPLQIGGGGESRKIVARIYN